MAFALVFASGALFAACGAGGGAPEPPGDSNDGAETEAGAETGAKTETGGENPVVVMTIADYGDIEIELDPAAAPISVENFLTLVDQGFYDGLTFHRIIPGFMIQGGDPAGTGAGPGSGKTIKGEFVENGWDNPISFKRGVIGMARTDDFNSASCQFFIMSFDKEHLDGQYAAFGHVLSGMEVVDEISAIPTDPNDRPNTPVVIESIRIK